MKTLKMFEIIEYCNDLKSSVLIKQIVPYKKSLLTYYTDYFTSEPFLMVTSVFNAAQYGIIVPMDEFMESVCEYLNDNNCTDPDSETYSEYETICFNSIPLSNL